MTSEFYAHVNVGDCDIAVPASDIVQAVDVPASGPMQLPRRDGRRHGALAGLIEFAGSVVPLVALDRWVPMGRTDHALTPRILVLRKGPSLIAIQVDALRGIKRVAASAIRTVCHDGSDEELFEAVAPATSEWPLLCLLDVARLMKLATSWCAEADVQPGTSGLAVSSDKLVQQRPAGSVRYVVCTIGTDVWAIPAVAVSRLEKTPPAEFRLMGRRVCGIGSWDARKVPLVDLGFAHDEAGMSRPWMAVVTDGTHAIGLVVDSCDRLVNLVADDVLETPGDELRSGTAMLPDLGRVSALDIDRLFSAVPEATISRVSSETDVKRTTPRLEAHVQARTSAGSRTRSSAALTVDGIENPDYLVFEADRPYATPATGLIGVMKLPQGAIDDFAQGRRATVDWRGQTLGVVRVPQIDGGKAKFEPRLAVVVKGTNEGDCQRALAVCSLTRWLPARSVQRSVMRIPSVGEVDVVTPPGARRSESLVVVDLAQMAYLLD